MRNLIIGDSISIALWFMALLIIVYLATFTGFTDYLLIPFALLIGGTVAQLLVSGRIPEQDISMSEEEGKRIIYYVLLALGGIGLGSFLIPGLFTPQMPIEMAIYDKYLFGALFAVSEERFFRGGLTSFLMWQIRGMRMLVHFASASLFAIYHLAVYGSEMENLIYVLIAGVLLSYVTLESRRLSPSSLAHLINNAMAVA